MRSIRTNITRVQITSLLLLFAFVTGLVYWFVKGALLDQFDSSLADKVYTVADISEIRSSGIVAFEFRDLQIPIYQPSPETHYFQVWDRSGESLTRSPSLGEHNLPQLDSELNTLTFQDIDLPDGRRGRAAFLFFAPRPSRSLFDDPETYRTLAEQNQLRIAVASSRENLDATLWILLTALPAAIVLLPGGTILIVSATVKRGLFPLNRIASEIEAIDAYNPKQRIGTGDLPEELVPICTRFNELVDRFDDALSREQRFTANVSHELRTPISELRTLVDVGAAEAEKQQAFGYQEYFLDALEIIKGMEHLVSTLLTLQKAESQKPDIRKKTVDLLNSAQRAWQRNHELAKRREIECEFKVPEEIAVTTDERLLSAILTNLFTNAVLYSPFKSLVQCEVAEDSSQVRFTLRNQSEPKLENTDLPHVTDPFWRKDQARSDSEHVGLGLALVQAYATLLGLELRVDQSSRGVFEVALLFS